MDWVKSFPQTPTATLSTGRCSITANGSDESGFIDVVLRHEHLFDVRPPNLAYLPNVERLEIRITNWGADSNIRVLEDWILARKAQGCALHAVRSISCYEGVRPFYARLVANNLVSSITWIDDYGT
jgi:hypothetical protein